LMNWTSIFASGVIAAVVSGLFNLYFKKQDYKNEYRKYILEKRKKAYEKIEVIVFLFCDTTYFHGEDRLKMTASIFCFENEDQNRILDILIKISNIGGDKFWCSFHMNLLIFHLKYFLEHANKEHYSYSKSPEGYSNEFAEKHRARWRKLKQELTKQFMTDLKSVDNVSYHNSYKWYNRFIRKPH
jgi:hypothetical protein